MTAFSDISCEFELSAGTWTDLYQDVLGAVSYTGGIRSTHPMDRIASTGVLKLTLLNHDNEYTPTHTNCLSGFEKNVPFRITVTYDSTTITKFYGRVALIDPRPSNGLDWYTDVWVYDYMNQIMLHELQLPDLAENRKLEEVVALILTEIEIPPLNAEVYGGEDTFATVFDTTKASTKAIQEMAKAVNSEFGYVYVRHQLRGNSDYPAKIEVTGAGTAAVNNSYYFHILLFGRPSYLGGNYVLAWSGSAWGIYDASVNRYYYSDDDVASPDLCTTWNVGASGDADAPDVDASTDSDEVLVSEGRETRDDVTSSATFTDEDLSGIGTKYGQHYYNDVKTIVYPRKVDAAATSVLFTLNHSIKILAGETEVFTGRFKDPDQKAQYITGRDMVTPVATTDYLFNTASDGSGSNITSDLTVTADYGANGVEYTLVNGNAGTGYVTFLQARGKGIYVYDKVEYNEEYADGIAADGRRTLNVSMPYQGDPIFGKDAAEIIIDIAKEKRLDIQSITFEANKNATLIEYFRDLSVGDRITLDLDDLDIEDDFFINGINVTITENGIAFCTYTLFPQITIGA